MRKAGNRIRVLVQLVNVADSSHLWSETYDRTLQDIFAVQDDIAVVRELRTTLLGEAADSDASGAAKAEASLRELIEKDAEDSAYQVAEVYGARGQADAAFEWLARAYTQRDAGLNQLKSCPHLRSLHGDPRWDALLKKVGLAD